MTNNTQLIFWLVFTAKYVYLKASMHHSGFA